MKITWTDKELESSVIAYLEMLKLHNKGKPYNKTEYYNALAKKHISRSSKSFEYRMQNISYVLSIMGRQWISGLKPAKNVGSTVAAKLEKLISKHENRKYPDIAEFEASVKNEMQKKSHRKPEGLAKPKTKIAHVTEFSRCVQVKAWVLKEANGICERCESPAPFYTVDKLPFLEVHHVRRLIDGGSDTVGNAVAICPNCHREMHYGIKSSEVADELYSKVPRLIRE